MAWVETRNLATKDRDLAWRIMAATAMDQDRLKKEAGIKSTGRKSAKSVLHFTLSWHEEDGEYLTREEMLRAANGALRCLGASDHQAMIVAHTDEKHPHVHVLVNRVSPEDGRMLPSSKEKLNLSKWAERYERERGRIYCTQRILNNAARARGEYVRGKKDQARHIYELQSAANQNDPKAAQIQAWLKSQAAAIAARRRQNEERHRREWAELTQRYLDNTAEIKNRAIKAEVLDRDLVRSQFRGAWEKARQHELAELRTFEALEERFSGRIRNALRAIDFGVIFKGGDRRKAIRDAYNAISDRGARLEALKADQVAAADQLLTQQRKAEQAAAVRARQRRDEELARNQAAFMAERADLLLRQAMDDAAIRAAWDTHRKQREKAWAPLHENLEASASQLGNRTLAKELEDFSKRLHERDHTLDFDIE